ncbi:MAG: type 2 periplasmic-binding domain-containing protein, partial [Acidimicrobiales bacterium]
KPHAWGNPAIVKALTDIQQLVKAGAFQPGYDAVDFGSETDALMYTGRAAMTLMGDWDISSLLGEDPSFVKSGELGQAPFPSIPGGKGNAADLSGNTTTYLAIASHITAAQKYVAEQFLEDSFTTPQFAKTEVTTGQVPVLKGSGALLGKTSLSHYLVPIYDSVVKAPSFQYSWDQALGSQRAQPMLTNLSKVFELTETPQQFVSTLESSSTGA